jgi:hypothetical protein
MILGTRIFLVFWNIEESFKKKFKQESHSILFNFYPYFPFFKIWFYLVPYCKKKRLDTRYIFYRVV